MPTGYYVAVSLSWFSGIAHTEHRSIEPVMAECCTILGRVCAPGPARPSQPKRTRRGQACPNCCNAACLRTCTDSARPRRAGVCDPILSRAQTPTVTNCQAQIVFASCCARPGPKRRKNSMINREANTLNENIQKT